LVDDHDPAEEAAVAVGLVEVLAAAAAVVAVGGMVPVAAAAADVKTIQQVEPPAVREVTTTLASPVPAAAALAAAAKTANVAMIAVAAFVVEMVAEFVSASVTIGTLLLPETFAASIQQDPNFVVAVTEAAVAAAGQALGLDSALAAAVAENGIPAVVGHNNIHVDDTAAEAKLVP
jgi:hypothetical protein